MCPYTYTYVCLLDWWVHSAGHPMRNAYMALILCREDAWKLPATWWLVAGGSFIT